MIQEKINSFDCHVCTGCGKCHRNKEYQEKIHVVTHSMNREGDESPIFAKNLEEGQFLIAVDLGTTTIAMQLYDHRGNCLDTFVRVNPQTMYGADVLSRIEASENRSSFLSLQNQARGVLEEGMRAFENRGFLPAKKGNRTLFVAGNTTMLYLLKGHTPRELGHAPFHATYLEEEQFSVDGVPCFCLPGFSAFVGGDIYSGLLYEHCLESSGMDHTLFIDLGTNGEMALVTPNRLYVCATAAGPAFEGGPNRGIWGADMVHLMAFLLREGYVDRTGLLQEPYFEKGIRTFDLVITQENIRALQLAKAAIAAGIHILLEKAGIVPEDVNRVLLAGGFGYYLNPNDAASIGLLPASFLNRTKAVGNTSLKGAALYGSLRLGGFSLPGALAEVINLAEYPGFDEIYLRNIDY